MFFSMLALAWSMAAKAWSSLATMVRCSSRGGMGIAMFSMCDLLIELNTAPAYIYN